MSLIPCDDDCVYQKDGYCQLDTPAAVTNHTEKGCVHYIKLTHPMGENTLPAVTVFDPTTPQRPV